MQLYPWYMQTGPGVSNRTTLAAAGHKGAPGGDCPKENSTATLVLGCTWTLALLGGQRLLLAPALVTHSQLCEH